MFCKNESLILPNAWTVLVVTAVQFAQPDFVLPYADFTWCNFIDVSGAVPEFYQRFGQPQMFKNHESGSRKNLDWLKNHKTKRNAKLRLFLFAF